MTGLVVESWPRSYESAGRMSTNKSLECKLDAQASAFPWGGVMHLLAPRACIENALHFEIPGEIQRELMNLIITAQHQNLHVELAFERLIG